MITCTDDECPGNNVDDGAVLIGVGSNLSSADGRSPLQVCAAALDALRAQGIAIVARSRWYRSAPVPVSGQPWFINGVARLNSAGDPRALLACLHGIEADFGRVRRRRWEARILDLDLLAHGRAVIDEESGLTVPHPAMMERVFVLAPLLEVAPDWRHPVTGQRADDALAACPADQRVEPVPVG